MTILQLICYSKFQQFLLWYLISISISWKMTSQMTTYDFDSNIKKLVDSSINWILRLVRHYIWDRKPMSELISDRHVYLDSHPEWDEWYSWCLKIAVHYACMCVCIHPYIIIHAFVHIYIPGPGIYYERLIKMIMFGVMEDKNIRGRPWKE